MRCRLWVVVLPAAVALTACESAPTEAVDGTTDASALASAEGSHGAVRWIPDPNCGVLDGTGNFFVVDCRNQVATFSRNGNALALTQATGVPNPSGQLWRWDAWSPPPILLELWGLGEPPAPCWVIGPEGEALFTTNWQAVVTPSGSARLTCHFARKWEWTPPPDWPPE